MLLVTYNCNLRCTYCYEPKTNIKQINLEQAKSFIRTQVLSLDSCYEEFEVQFMGGEPLLVFATIRDLSEWLWQQSWPLPLKQIFFPTNGTLLTPEIKTWLVEHNEKICLGLSFDGTRLMQNINRSQSAPLVNLDFFLQNWPEQSIKMTLSPNTLSYLYDGVIFLNKKGFSHVTVDLAMGNTIVWKQSHLVEFAKQLNLLADYYLKNPHIPRASMLDMDVTLVLKRRTSLKKCSCGEDLVCIDCDGQIYACHLFSPISSSLSIAKQSQSIDFHNHEIFVNEVCRNCLLFPLCTSCYGMNYKLSGDICKQDAFTCKAFKIQFLVMCKMQLQLADVEGNEARKKIIQKLVSHL